MKDIVKSTHLFFDFDSTFSQVEGLDELIKICIQNEEELKAVHQKMNALTNQAMNGEIDFRESIEKRLQLFNAKKADIVALSETLKKKVSSSIKAHQDYLIKNKDQIYIISNGFLDFILPVIEDFGLHTNQVFANEFLYDDDKVVGINTNSPLSKSGGKPKVIESLKLEGKIIMIGDGFNDYEVKKYHASDLFILYTENITREKVIPFADAIAKNFEDIINTINK